jgi:hypothetical protein
LNWTLTNSPAYTSIINTTDGGSHSFNRRERPHLLFENGLPIMLFTSLTNWNFTVFGTDKAFTFGQRIGVDSQPQPPAAADRQP